MNMGKVVVRGQKARDLAVEIIHNGGTFEDAAKATGFGADYCRQLAKRSGMNFKKSKDDYIDEVALLSRVGQSAEEISAALSISISSVRRIAKENQIKIPRKASPSKFSEHEGYIRKAISAGKTYSDVARELGFDPKKTAEWCRKHGVNLTEEGKAKGFYDSHKVRFDSEEVKKNSVSYVYIGGYVNSDSIIDVECTVCKRRTKISYQQIRKATAPIECRLCRSDASADRRAERQRLKEEQRAQREEQRRKKREEEEAAHADLMAKRWHACPVCGKMTSRPKYCSRECSNKLLWANHDHKRRVKIQAAMIDKDISLEEVFRRDNGICYICGMACEWDDCKRMGNVFIAGRLYPTIDHVVPLARGGEHRWENVRLAHKCCNSAKGARTA